MIYYALLEKQGLQIMERIKEIEEYLFKLITGYRATQAIYVAVKLEIIDLLYNNPLTINQLCKFINTPQNNIERLIYILIKINLISKDENNIYSLTETATYLAKQKKNNLKSRVLFHGNLAYQAWGELEYSIKKGKSGFNKRYSEDFFSYLDKHKKESEIFNSLMVNSQIEASLEIVSNYDFDESEIIVDIGGGYGELAHSIVTRYKNKKVIVLETKQVVNEAIEKNNKHNVIYQTGDFLLNIPSGDTYILKRILHDWNDVNALKILHKCNASLLPNGKLLIIEMLLSEKSTPNLEMWLDLNMLVLFNGKERTEKEFIGLCFQANFKFIKTIKVNDTLNILEFKQMSNIAMAIVKE